MSKITAMFFLAMFLCCILTHSASPEPAFHKESLIVTQHQDAEAVDESCEGIREEECLMRRTLAAHIDYIYTQKHNP
ncbi:phytosulfokines-like [Abrus precatorius]|uniref:Phytosulfokine n=1 Tax=Abrus precatorius TaxID=3816 RepID=A0A8B8M529_ABRPR|nr:phytosulfokines-like [Abrus precatorius]